MSKGWRKREKVGEGETSFCIISNRQRSLSVQLTERPGISKPSFILSVFLRPLSLSREGPQEGKQALSALSSPKHAFSLPPLQLKGPELPCDVTAGC